MALTVELVSTSRQASICCACLFFALQATECGVDTLGVHCLLCLLCPVVNSYATDEETGSELGFPSGQLGYVTLQGPSLHFPAPCS